MTAFIEPIVGRYLNLEIDGRNNRVYFEEAGEGIPLVCLHTAGADGRQWRHLLTDPEITRHFRVLAFDLPWHGKSYPPAGWRGEEYRLTTAGYTETIRSFCRALELDLLQVCEAGQDWVDVPSQRGRWRRRCHDSGQGFQGTAVYR